MPLTPEANLWPVRRIFGVMETVHVLDKLLSLNVGHAVHAGDTITSETRRLAHVSSHQIPSI